MSDEFDIEHCKALLHQHARLRMPMFRRDPHHADGPAHTAQQKVELLEDYLGSVAVARGDLEEARLWADHIRHVLDDQWGRIEGWQQSVSSPNKATGPQIVEAKRKIKPDIYDAMREAKWVIARLNDQIRRLEKDEDVASRRYTLIVGS